MTIYTGGGDKGSTSLLSGQRVSKADAMVEAYGTLDELGAQLGLCRGLCLEKGAGDVIHLILGLQRDLFRVGMQLSSDREYWSRLERPIRGADIKMLEETIDKLETVYGLPTFFVAPGETVIGASLHVARTICRRAERRVVAASAGEMGFELVLRYLNRLSDLLFSLSWAMEIRELIVTELNRS